MAGDERGEQGAVEHVAGAERAAVADDLIREPEPGRLVPNRGGAVGPAFQGDAAVGAARRDDERGTLLERLSSAPG